MCNRKYTCCISRPVTTIFFAKTFIKVFVFLNKQKKNNNAEMVILTIVLQRLYMGQLRELHILL